MQVVPWFAAGPFLGRLFLFGADGAAGLGLFMLMGLVDAGGAC